MTEADKIRAKKTLERIEFKKRTFKCDFARKWAIWEVISFKITIHEGKKYLFWCEVMDLYNKKYRNNEL